MLRHHAGYLAFPYHYVTTKHMHGHNLDKNCDRRNLNWSIILLYYTGVTVCIVKPRSRRTFHF